MSHKNKLSGKVAIVTASTDGIGFAIAQRLAEDGAKVMLSSRKQSNVDRAVKSLKDKGLTVSGMVCHVAKKEQRQKMIEGTLEEFGGVDILVCNAAVNPIFGPILNTTEDAWDKIMEVNLKSTFFLVKEVVPHMEKRGSSYSSSGAIVLVSSTAGYNPSEFLGAYSISKTAMLGMVKALVPQLAQMNVRINCLAPAVIETKFSEALWKSEFSDDVKNTIPLRRFGKSEECARIVSLLVSDDASYITGETVVVSGGSNSRL